MTALYGLGCSVLGGLSLVSVTELHALSSPTVGDDSAGSSASEISDTRPSTEHSKPYRPDTTDFGDSPGQERPAIKKETAMCTTWATVPERIPLL